MLRFRRDQKHPLAPRASRTGFRAPNSTQSVVTKRPGEASASRGGTAGLMLDPRRIVVLAAVALLALGPGLAAASPAKSKRAAVATAAPPPPAPIEPLPPPKIYLFRGAMGPIFSTGMDRLEEKLTQAGFSANVYEFTICRWIGDRAIASYKESPAPIVLIGHSMGGLCSIVISEMAAKRDALRDFLQRVVRAQVWSYRHVDSFSATLARIIGIAPEAARLQFARRQTVWRPIDARIVAEQQRTADFYVKVGLLKQRLEVATTFDAGFPLTA